jgi:exodeoxyribonuclease-3
MRKTLATLNSNGIRSADRRGFLRWLKRHRPDVLCLQELRALEQDVEDELRSPAGWNARWFPAAKKGYSGVGIYSREAPERYEQGHGFELCADEGRGLRADFRDLSVISLYVPSGASKPERQALKFRFLDELLPWTESLLSERRPMVLCGDFNIAHTEIDIHDPKGNAKNSGFLPEEREWFTRLLAQGPGGRTEAARERRIWAGASTTACARRSSHRACSGPGSRRKPVSPTTRRSGSNTRPHRDRTVR